MELDVNPGSGILLSVFIIIPNKGINLIVMSGDLVIYSAKILASAWHRVEAEKMLVVITLAFKEVRKSQIFILFKNLGEVGTLFPL